jgi:hypothetical protein
MAGLLLVLGACVPICGIGAKFTLSNATVDPSYKCPNPANQTPYTVHATINADNSTSNPVTIKSISETWTNVAIHGSWNGKKGDHGTTQVEQFSPKTVASGASTTIKFTIPFQCTNNGAGGDTYGDFSFNFVVVTSAGTYRMDSTNKHRLTFA